MPSFSIWCSSSASNETFASATTFWQRRANSRGVSALPGSLAMSRARLLHSPRMRPRAIALLTRDTESGEGTTTIHDDGFDGAGSVVL